MCQAQEITKLALSTLHAQVQPGMTFRIIPWMWGVDGNKTSGISDTIYIADRG